MVNIGISEEAKLKRLIRNSLIFSFTMHIIAAWFSLGYHHLDEHFQILEFAGYKMGITPIQNLPWEYAARLRPTIQPAFIVAIYKIIGPNPFTAAFLLRLFSSVLGFFSVYFLLNISLKWFSGYAAKRFLVLSACLFYFFPYLHAHFSAESISGSVFFIGLGCAWLAKDKQKDYWLLISGLLLGLAFVCRYQTGFLILGLAIWAVFFAKFSFRQLLLLGLPLLFVIFLGIVIDHWFYGEWVFTVWNYFKVNLIEGKAAEFGVRPWWAYFEWNLLDLLPPFSIAIMAGVIYAIYKNPKNIISLSVLPFILVHFLISHKEARFLFPLANAVPILLAMVYQSLKLEQKQSLKIYKWSFSVFWAASIIMMTISSVKPANDYMVFYDYVYKNYNNEKSTMLCKGPMPYDLHGLTVFFYQPTQMKYIENITVKQTDSFIAKPGPDPVLILFRSQIEADHFHKTHPTISQVYISIPAWMKYININDWISRTKIWILFEVKGK